MNDWKWLRPAVWGFYLIVVLEFLFMISPFALHFYSGYAPVLSWLNQSSATAWLTGFFLPHFSVTSSPLLNLLKPIGFLLAGLGLLLFLVGAIQIYAAKLLGWGAVTGGLYRLVRHPQYFALTILGFGVTLIWSRFLVLLSFLSMLFLYYALARWEEKQCVQSFGDSYRDYQRRTGMILPRWGERDAAVNMSWRRGLLLYVGCMAAALVLAYGARGYSLAHVSHYFEDDVAILSPAILGSQELREAYRTARQEKDLDQILRQESKLLVYVVPGSWYLPDLPLHTEAEIRRVGGGHSTPQEWDPIYRVLFARPRYHGTAGSGAAIVTGAHGLQPLAIMRVDLSEDKPLGLDEMPEHVIWGDIPTPLF